MRESIVSFTLGAYETMLPIAAWALLIAVIVLLPMLLIRKTRGAAGIGLMIVSYLIGLTTWLLGCGITFGAYGWMGLVIGLFLFGVGVVPLAMIAAIFKFKVWSLAISLLVMVIITFAARLGGAAAVESVE